MGSSIAEANWGAGQQDNRGSVYNDGDIGHSELRYGSAPTAPDSESTSVFVDAVNRYGQNGVDDYEGVDVASLGGGLGLRKPSLAAVGGTGLKAVGGLGLSASSSGLGLNLNSDSGATSIFDLGSRFVRGAFYGAVNMVWQPIAQTLDLGQAGVGLLSSGAYEPRWLSGTAQNYASGMSWGEVSLRSMTGIPLIGQALGVGFSSYDLTTSALQGDWGSVAEQADGLLVGGAAVKYGGRYLAPEAGAQFGVQRLGTRLPYDITDTAGVSGGKLPPLAADRTDTFNGVPMPREFAQGELRRVYEAGNRRAPLEGRYWMTETPLSEAGWRGPSAVLKSWDNAGTDLAILQRPSTWAWFGETAAMAIPGNSYRFGNYAAGWYQPGGKQQAMIPNSFSIINSGNTTTSLTPWTKR